MKAPSTPKKSVILLSGGLDSAANLALCAEEDLPILALTIDYGQKAAPNEVRAAAEFCLHYGVRHRVIELPWMKALGVSALTSDQSVPEVAASDLDRLSVTEKTAQAVWVPNRNGVFLNVAAAFAESLGCDQVVVGFNLEEAATFPDNSVAFLEKQNEALGYSTANSVRVRSYTAHLNKTEIVEQLVALDKQGGRGFPFALVWSCYLSGDEMCGKCESCRRFVRAVGSQRVGVARLPILLDRSEAVSGIQCR